MSESETGGIAPEHGVVSTDPKVPQEFVDRAVQSVRVLAGWHIFPERVEEIVLLAPGDGQVILPTKRLVDVESVVVDGHTFEVDQLVYDEAGVVWVPGLKPRRDGVPRRVVAKIRHGFNEPVELISVITSMALRAAQSQSSYSLDRISVGGISVGASAGNGVGGAVAPVSTEWRILDEYKLKARP